jgi:hypothetical protein
MLDCAQSRSMASESMGQLASTTLFAAGRVVAHLAR